MLSEDQATSDIPLVCPVKFLINAPVKGDQILTIVSPASAHIRCIQAIGLGSKVQDWNEPQDASITPSWLNLTADSDLVCPCIVWRSS